MKTLPLVILAVLVMAATGCQTTKQMEAKGYVKNIYGEWMKPGTSYFGDGDPRKRRPAPAFARSPSSRGGDIGPIPNLIPLPDWGPSGGSTPQVIVTGNAPVTTITPIPTGGTRVVNYGVPDYRPAVAPYPYYGY